MWIELSSIDTWSMVGGRDRRLICLLAVFSLFDLIVVTCTLKHADCDLIYTYESLTILKHLSKYFTFLPTSRYFRTQKNSERK